MPYDYSGEWGVEREGSTNPALYSTPSSLHRLPNLNPSLERGVNVPGSSQKRGE